MTTSCLLFGHSPSPETVASDITTDGYDCAKCGARRLWKHESRAVKKARASGLIKLGILQPPEGGANA